MPAPISGETCIVGIGETACARSRQAPAQTAHTGGICALVNVVHPMYPGTETLVPFTFAAVNHDGAGIRVFGNVCGADVRDLPIGRRAREACDRADPDVVLPRWKRKP